MAHSYSHLYGLPTTGLRFFTVYGPWGRPDMSPILFADAIMRGEPIRVFNEGRHRRDFTYIDDIVEGVLRVSSNRSRDPRLVRPVARSRQQRAPWRIYNIGRGEPVALLDYIELMEQALGAAPKRNWCRPSRATSKRPLPISNRWPRTPVIDPQVSLAEGLVRFADWYREYYGKKIVILGGE